MQDKEEGAEEAVETLQVISSWSGIDSYCVLYRILNYMVYVCDMNLMKFTIICNG